MAADDGDLELLEGPSDAELIQRTRSGDAEAYATLFDRHRPSAFAAARSLTRSRDAADDLVSEAFAKILSLLQRGGGPELAFRPYLVTTIRNQFVDGRRRKSSDEVVSDTLEEAVNVRLLELAESSGDRALIVGAFARLPERWQTVLWHLEVERDSPVEIAQRLGMSPNAVSALAYRAREGLRQEYLTQHVHRASNEACFECRQQLGAFVRDRLSARESTHVQRHLDQCDECAALVPQLQTVNTVLQSSLVPVLLGVATKVYLGGAAAKLPAPLFWLWRMRPRPQQAAVGGAVAGVIAVAVALAVAGGDTPDPLPAAATTHAPTTTELVASLAAPVAAEPPAVQATSPVPSAPAISPVPSPAPSIEPAAPIVAAPIVTGPSVPPATTLAPPVTEPPDPAPTTTPTTPAPTSAPTTVAPTTLAPSPPSIVLVASSPVLAGGRFQMSVGVTSAAPVGRVEFAVSPGVTLVAASPWTCSPTPVGVACEVAGMHAATLTLLAPAAGTPITITPIGSDLGVPVDSPAVVVQPTGTDLGVIFAATMHGALTAGGNAILTCNASAPGCVDAQQGLGPRLDRQQHALDFVDVDGRAETFNSSSAQLAWSGQVTHAELVWSGDVEVDSASAPDPASRHLIELSTPAGPAFVAADAIWATGDDGEYSAIVDVTALVRAGGPGDYVVANLQTAARQRSFGGWALMVVVADSALPERVIVISAPRTTIDRDAPYTGSLALQARAAAGRAEVWAAAFDGELGLEPDRLSVNGFDAGSGNFFDSSMAGRLAPAHRNGFGATLRSAAVALSGATSIDLAITSEREVVRVVALGWSIELA